VEDVGRAPVPDNARGADESDLPVRRQGDADSEVGSSGPLRCRAILIAPAPSRAWIAARPNRREPSCTARHGQRRSESGAR